MKKISIIGLTLGAILGMAVALIFGKWLFWLGTGLALGLFVGSAQKRREPLADNEVSVRRASL